MRLVFIFIAFVPFLLLAQNQKCGLPNYYPKQGEAHTFRDTCNYISYEFKRNDLKWYATSVIISASTPQATITNGSIIVSNERTEWYNTTNSVYYKWNGTGWESPSVNINNVVFTIGDQTIAGKKTFSDTIKATKGLKSEGEVDTKGVTTSGSSTKAATTINGVKKGKRRYIIGNTTLDGNDFFLEVACTTSDIEIICPPLSIETEGWIFDVKRTDETTYVVKFKRPDNSYIRILSKRSAILRNNGTNWYFD